MLPGALPTLSHQLSLQQARSQPFPGHSTAAAPGPFANKAFEMGPFLPLPHLHAAASAQQPSQAGANAGMLRGAALLGAKPRNLDPGHGIAHRGANGHVGQPRHPAAAALGPRNGDWNAFGHSGASYMQELEQAVNASLQDQNPGRPPSASCFRPSVAI